MDDLETRFAGAAQEAQNLPKRPSDVDLLKLYAHYKQATVGDVTGSRPGLTDFTGRAKFDAWSRLKGTTKDEAMQAYVDLVANLKRPR
ncbi:MAG TPA: acyl-CoA-binding protein [Anaerolineae bacterium]